MFQCNSLFFKRNCQKPQKKDIYENFLEKNGQNDQKTILTFILYTKVTFKNLYLINSAIFFGTVWLVND